MFKLHVSGQDIEHDQYGVLVVGQEQSVAFVAANGTMPGKDYVVRPHFEVIAVDVGGVDQFLQEIGDAEFHRSGDIFGIVFACFGWKMY